MLGFGTPKLKQNLQPSSSFETLTHFEDADSIDISIRDSAMPTVERMRETPISNSNSPKMSHKSKS